MKPADARRACVSPFVGALARRAELGGAVIHEVQDDPLESVGLHAHDEAQLCLLLSDGYASSARGLDGACGRGTLIYNPPGTCHADHFERRGGSFIAITLASTMLASAREAASLPPVALGLSLPSAAVCGARAMAELRAPDACSELELEALVLELLTLVSSGVERTYSEKPAWLRRAADTVRDASPASLPSVRTLAAEVGVHPVSLARAFRRHLGAGPGEYLRWRRIERSLSLITRDFPLAHVALAAGFSDQTTFTRAFRKVLGTTPAAYRARMCNATRAEVVASGRFLAKRIAPRAR